MGTCRGSHFFTTHKKLQTFPNPESITAKVKYQNILEEVHNQVQEQPAHKLAIPLFIITSIPYFATVIYEYFGCCEPDHTFAWFGIFYLGLGAVYFLKRMLKS